MSRVARVLARFRDDPDMFHSTILRRPAYWWRQTEAAQSVAENRDTVVCSGNAVGKDYLVAGLILWWLLTRRNALVIVTGPSQTLLGTVLWKELRRAIAQARLPLGGHITQGVCSSPHRLDFGDGWGALGFSTNNVERASGQHARDVLVIAEEASGLPPHAWEAIDGLKYARLMAIGNPIRADGRFVDLIRQGERDERDGAPAHLRVKALRIPSTESPHAHLEHSPYGLADKTWLEANERRYGKDSPWVRSHIHALIPEVSGQALWIRRGSTPARRCARRSGRPYPQKLWLAVDLAEGVGRDWTVLCSYATTWGSSTSGCRTSGVSPARRTRWLGWPSNGVCRTTGSASTAWAPAATSSTTCGRWGSWGRSPILAKVGRWSRRGTRTCGARRRGSCGVG